MKKADLSLAFSLTSSSVIVWISGGFILGGAITPEFGQFLWLLMVISVGAVLAELSESSARSLICRALLPSCMLLGAALDTEALRLTFIIAKGLLAGELVIPLAAFTQEQLLVRYGLFFLFLLFATPPAILVTTYLGEQFLVFSRLFRLPCINILIQFFRALVVGVIVWLIKSH